MLDPKNVLKGPLAAVSLFGLFQTVTGLFSFLQKKLSKSYRCSLVFLRSETFFKSFSPSLFPSSDLLGIAGADG